MKVLVISAAYPPMHAGEAANTYFLAKHLADKGCDVHILTSRGNAGIPHEHIRVYPIMGSWGWFSIFRLRSFIRRCSPDAILLMYLGWMYNFHPMITFTPTIAKKALPRVSFVTRFENVFVGADPEKTCLLSRAFRRLIVRWANGAGVAYGEGTLVRDSDRVIVLCERHYSMLLEGSGDANRIVIIPPPPNIRMCGDDSATARRRGRERLGIAAEETVIAFFGYIYPWKGLETLLEAFRIIRDGNRNVRLLVIGGRNDLDAEVDSAYIDEMHELTRRLGVEDQTTWTGAFAPDSEDASVYLYASDVCVLPFVYGIQMNNSSLASIAAHGRPLVATRGARVETPLRDRENVVLCPPRDAEALARAIDPLIRDPELRRCLSTGISQLAREWFSWEKALERTIEALRATQGASLEVPRSFG